MTNVIVDAPVIDMDVGARSHDLLRKIGRPAGWQRLRDRRRGGQSLARSAPVSVSVLLG
jgi:hypothetical protein